MMHDHEVESLTCQNDTICEVRSLATLSKIRAINDLVHSGQKCFIRVGCLWSKMPTLQRAGMREGGKPVPLLFQHLILMIGRPFDLNLVMIFSLASKCQHFKLRGLQFH